jgi:hypothetical protein
MSRDMKSHPRIVFVIAFSALLLTGCVAQQWRLFRLDSLRPNSKGQYELGQMWYGPVDEVNGWEVQLSVVALIAAWQNENMQTDTFGVRVRMMRLDSLSRSDFRVDSLVLTTLPDSSRYPLMCVRNRIDTLQPRFRYMTFPNIRIPSAVDTILVDFNLVALRDNDTLITTKDYHRRLVRFDKAFHVFAAIAD